MLLQFPLRADGRHHPRERQLAILQHFEHHRPLAPQLTAERILQIERHTQGQWIDQAADQLAQLRPVAQGHRRTDHQVRLSGQASQQQAKSRQQHHVRRGAGVPRQAAQPIGQPCLQTEGGTPRDLRPRRRTYQRLQCRRWRGSEYFPPALQDACLTLRIDPARRTRVVRIPDLHSRQRRRPTAAQGGVECGQILTDHRHRQAIGDDVMRGDQQHMLPGIDPTELRFQQRTVQQVERLTQRGGGNLQQTFGRSADIHLRQRCCSRQGWRCLLPDLAVTLDEARAQDGVSHQQGLPGLREQHCIERTLDADCKLFAGTGVLRIELLQEPQALLWKGERHRTVGRQMRQQLAFASAERLAQLGGQRTGGCIIEQTSALDAQPDSRRARCREQLRDGHSSPCSRSVPPLAAGIRLRASAAASAAA